MIQRTRKVICTNETLDGLVNTRYNVCIAGNDKRTPAPQVEPESENPSKRKAMTQKNLQKQLDTFRRQNYGSTSTIGARQVSILADIGAMNAAGMRVSLDTLSLRHPSHALNGDSFFALRARKLVKGNRYSLQLTPAGQEVFRLVSKCTVPAGLGLVAIGMPVKR